ncbi:vWA domain-containing protein [Streptomyces sp. NBC_00358]|uniref:vWA domain-containing protein n=1 Tax=Streptomyces sp. NBC_00358 TaxID=2975725 RepID=UPI002E25E00C
MTHTQDPRAAVTALADSSAPYLLGVRHHSPALAAAVPALLDAYGAEVVCVELPADFQPWLTHLAAPGTVAPVALAGAGENGRLGFYPFADFSPELAAVRWARDRGAEVVCCDLPMSDPRWTADGPLPTADARTTVADVAPPAASVTFGNALAASGTGRDDDDLWDRCVEVLAPGSAPDAIRRAALGVGWALRSDAEAAGGAPAVDLAREARMRETIARASAGGRRVAAVVGAFHAPALTAAAVTATARSLDADPGPGAAEAVPPTAGHGAAREHPGLVTSLVPYAFDLLDSRSGYPAGIRDPRWQQAVFQAGGDPERVRAAAARTVTDVCRELRSAGHTAGTGEAAETLRMACDLARVRGLAAPGRGEVIEALTTVMGQGEPLGRGRALARALEVVLVGTERGRIAPGTPRSGLGPCVEAEVAALRLPGPDDPTAREVRLDPLRSALDGRREILLQRLAVCGAGYGEAGAVAGTGDAAALTTRWRVAWTPAVPVRLDLAGIRGVTAALAAEGTLRETFRRESADGGPTCGQVLTALGAAARCGLPALVTERLADAATVLPAAATLPELLAALDLLETLCRGHLPGTTADSRQTAAELATEVLESAVRALPGLAGSDRPEDTAALIELASRAGEHRLGLRLDDALDTLARTGSPLVQGAALAARVLLDLDDADTLGARTAGWIDTATDPEARHALGRRLGGLLGGAAALLQSAPTALDPLLDRVDTLTDQGFLDRLPALRGGFDTLSPAGRDRLLHTVTERLGDRLDLSLDASPRLLALWTAADAAGLAALRALRLPGGTSVPTPGDSGISTGHGRPEHSGSVPAAAPRSGARSVEAPRASASSAALRITPTDRWRLLLGRETEKLPRGARRYAHALDELYGTGRGEGSFDLGREGGAHGRGGGREASFPTAREWAAELESLFGAEVREEVLARAADQGRVDVLAELDPAAVRPSVDLLASVLSLAGGMPERQLAALRPLVRRLVDELAKELATRMRPALTGLATPRPTRRPGGRLDLPRTLRANLAHARRTADGRTVVVPERPVFSTRSRKEADWRLILVVDVSGSMEASVIWSALTAAVLGGVPTLSTHFLAFSTDVIDLTDRVADPLSLLLEVRVGGGTHIAAGLAHARSLVTVPSRTLVVVVSDFEEGYPLGGLLGEVRALAGSGVHLMGCAALDDTGTPRYSVPVARQLVAAGMPVAALSPLALARWVGDRLRGESR